MAAQYSTLLYGHIMINGSKLFGDSVKGSELEYCVRPTYSTYVRSGYLVRDFYIHETKSLANSALTSMWTYFLTDSNRSCMRCTVQYQFMASNTSIFMSNWSNFDGRYSSYLCTVQYCHGTVIRVCDIGRKIWNERCCKNRYIFAVQFSLQNIEKWILDVHFQCHVGCIGITLSNSSYVTMDTSLCECSKMGYHINMEILVVWQNYCVF